MDTKSYIITIIIAMLPVVAISQELKIQSFALSPTEIIPGVEQRKDLNGVTCALVKVQVVDAIDRVEGNIIGEIDSRGTEKRIYMTQGTKMFRLYPHSHLPVSIVTSEYDIERLEGNRVYILRLTGDTKEVVDFQKKEVEQEQPRLQPETPSIPASDSITHHDLPLAFQAKNASGSKFHIYAGVGFNALSIIGPSVHLGARYGNSHLEADYVLGLDKVKEITYTQPDAALPTEAYDYSCSKLRARLGYCFGFGSFLVSPQVGVSFNLISGKAVSGFANSSDYFKESYPMSAFGAVRFSYKVTDHFHIHITPQYDISIGGDKVYEFAKQGDGKIKSWGEGFGINTGVIYVF